LIRDAHILITGGAGFIGTALSERLCNDNRLTLFDNMTRDAFSKTPLRDHKNVTLVQGDVLDLAALRAAAQDADVIVHMASIAGVDSVMRQPVLTMQVSLQGTMNALRVAHEGGRCRALRRLQHQRSVWPVRLQGDRRAM
jgi:UDP-glucose 4-epimerase